MLKTKAEIKEMCEVLQTGLSVIPMFNSIEDTLIIKVGDISFTQKNEAGLLVWIPDSKQVWQKWLGEFYLKLQKDKKLIKGEGK
jgi:hypothetical protein